jgi:hypothetical protein
MELAALYKRVVGLDVHQAQIAACALIEECDGAYVSNSDNSVRSRKIGACWPSGRHSCALTK